MNKLNFVIILLGSVLMQCYAEAQYAEAVWFANENDQYHVYIAHYDGEAWKAPDAPVYSADVPLNSPTLATGPDGEAWLLWTQQKRSKTILMAKRGQRSQSGAVDQSSWGDAEALPEFGNQNFAPSLVFDANSIGWLFWSASGPDLADIYLSKLINSIWRKPIKVNKNNEVPDIVPMASVLASGSIQVEWTTYDMQIGAYRLDSTNYLVETPPDFNKTSDDIQIDVSDVPAPQFVPGDRRVLLHFPRNKMRQTFALN